MQIIDFWAEAGFSDTRFGSQGFTVAPLVRAADSVVCLRVAAGGRIGRHPAVGRQVFALVDGEGVAIGADGIEQPVCAGQAVVWESGEEHETRTTRGLTAVVIEGSDLRLLLPFDPSTR